MGMSLTTVAELRSTLGVGTLYPDATLQSVCDAADTIVLPMLWNNDSFNIAHSADDDQRTLYFENLEKGQFYIGQAIVISDNDSIFDGTYVVNAVGEDSITYTHEDGGRERPYHLVRPFGKVAAQDDVDWSLDAAVQNAALMVSVEIWQARTATLSGSNAVDFQPSPYRMSAQLLAKVRGLLAHALSPNSMVG
jgi:hypothetical protein